MRVKLPPEARTLVSTVGAPLIADVSRGGQNIALLAFDIMDTNWPLNLSFPLFFQNVIAWAPRGSLADESTIAAGRPITVFPDPELETATLTRPGGATEEVRLDPVRPVFVSNTESVGMCTPYQLRRAPGRLRRERARPPRVRRYALGRA